MVFFEQNSKLFSFKTFQWNFLSMDGCSSVFNGEFPLACFHFQLPRLHRYLPQTPLWIRVDGILKSQHQTDFHLGRTWLGPYFRADCAQLNQELECRWPFSIGFYFMWQPIFKEYIWQPKLDTIWSKTRCMKQLSRRGYKYQFPGIWGYYK